MDMRLIDETISVLEQGETNFDTVSKLADLYIIKDKLAFNNLSSNSVKSEINDILPAYSRYINVKRLYQLNEINEGAVIKEIKNLCTEIQEFIEVLYSCTDMGKERKCIKSVIDTLYEKFAE